MGLKKMLFGESPSIEQKSTLTPEQQAILKSLGITLGGQIGQGVEAYGGDMYADPSGLNNTLFNYLNMVMTGSDPSTSKANAGIDALMAKFQTPIQEQPFDPQNITSYFEQGVRAPAMRNLNETVLPAIAEKYASKNALRSGAVMKEMFDTAGNLESDLSGQLSQLLYQGSEVNANRELQRKLGLESTYTSGMNQVIAQLLGQPINTMNAALPIAQQEQTLEQLPFTEAYNKWSSSQAYNNPWLQYLQQALGTNALQNIVNPGSSGLMPSLIQAGAKIATAGMV